jgi:hypothetical protein
VDSFTYHIVNEEDLAAVLADLTGDPLQTMTALFREAPDSLDLGRGIGHKSRIPVSGFHGSLYRPLRRAAREPAPGPDAVLAPGDG